MANTYDGQGSDRNIIKEQEEQMERERFGQSMLKHQAERLQKVAFLFTLGGTWLLLLALAAAMGVYWFEGYSLLWLMVLGFMLAGAGIALLMKASSTRRKAQALFKQFEKEEIRAERRAVR